MPASATVTDAVALRARRRIAWRLLPYVLLLYVIAYLDRNNLATAALQMPHDLGFDDRVIGFGAGIFALGTASHTYLEVDVRDQGAAATYETVANITDALT